jgi:hypothetical protein
LAQELPDLHVALGHDARERRTNQAIPDVLRRQRRARRGSLDAERQRAALRDPLLVFEVGDGALGLELLEAIALDAGLFLLGTRAVDVGPGLDGGQRRGPRIEPGQDLTGLDLLPPLDGCRQHAPVGVGSQIGLAITTQRAGEPQRARHVDAVHGLGLDRDRGLLGRASRSFRGLPLAARERRDRQHEQREPGRFRDDESFHESFRGQRGLRSETGMPAASRSDARAKARSASA